MKRELIIMRHAKSDWNSVAESDFDRPLAPRGKYNAPLMAEWLKQQKLHPDYMISSPAKRAKQTIKRVCQVYDYPLKQVHWEPSIYGASLSDLFAVLASVPKKYRLVLLVGHNPGLEHLATYLLDQTQVKQAVVLKTCSVIHLAMPVNWEHLEAKSAKLLTIQHPRDLVLD